MAETLMYIFPAHPSHFSYCFEKLWKSFLQKCAGLSKRHDLTSEIIVASSGSFPLRKDYMLGKKWKSYSWKVREVRWMRKYFTPDEP